MAFARTCTTDAECNAVVSGTTCTMGTTPSGTIHYCSAVGNANDDYVTASTIGGAQTIDVLANDTFANGYAVITSIGPTGGAGTGGATVTVTSVGICTLTARQAAGGSFNAAPNVVRQLATLLAPLKVFAPSPIIVYGEPLPALTPSYDGFKLTDTAATLTTAPTCSVTSTRGWSNVITGTAWATRCASRLRRWRS